MDYKKEIGRRLKAAREEQELSLGQLAGKTGLLKTRIENYEAGRRMPGPAEIKKFAEVLGEPAAYLMCLDEEEEDAMSREEAKFLRNWRALPENQRSDYARRIAALALAYKEAVPDERLSSDWKAPKPKKVKR